MELTDFYGTQAEYDRLLSRYHTVTTLQKECQRSRSWAYSMISHYPGDVRVLVNLRTGKKEMAVPRSYVTRYMLRVKRGNPYW